MIPYLTRFADANIARPIRRALKPSLFRSGRTLSLIAMTLAATCLLAQIPPIIQQKNQNSIVFIHSERRQKDGTGSRENSFGTGFLISSRGYVLTVLT